MPLIKAIRPGRNHYQAVRADSSEHEKIGCQRGVIMSVLLYHFEFRTTLLIPEHAYQEGGPASGRAIAYLAHEYLGNTFGTIYDISPSWCCGSRARRHGGPAALDSAVHARGLEWRRAWWQFRPLVLLLFGVKS